MENIKDISEFKEGKIYYSSWAQAGGRGGKMHCLIKLTGALSSRLYYSEGIFSAYKKPLKDNWMSFSPMGNSIYREATEEEIKFFESSLEKGSKNYSEDWPELAKNDPIYDIF